METARNCTDVDYNYYHKLMRKLFPTYNYNPQLMERPSEDFVLDIMQLFINYYDDLMKKLPPQMYNAANMAQDNKDAIEPKLIPMAWELLRKCNRLLREFNFGLEGPELFTIGDLVDPDSSTVNKIMFVLNICFHIHELDITEAEEKIQRILTENASIKDSQTLIKNKMDLEVASECLLHKLTQLKGKDEMERLYNEEVAKCVVSEKQRKEELDGVRSTLLQRRNKLKTCVEANEDLQGKLVNEDLVENIKSKLEVLKLKSKNQMIDGGNLITKINKSKSSKELLGYHLNVMENKKDLLKKQKEYLGMDDEFKIKLENKLHINADIEIQIDNCKKEKSFASDLDTKFDNWKENFRINKAKFEADTAAEEKKQDQLQCDINTTSEQIETVLIDLEKKYTRWENLNTSVKAMDVEVKTILGTILKETLDRLE